MVEIRYKTDKDMKSLTECPFGRMAFESTLLAGSIGCAYCKYYVDADRKNKIVKCNCSKYE